MPDGQQHSVLLDRLTHRPEPATASRSLLARSNAAIVDARIDRIMTLADAGLLYEAREACADLMFEFQPLLAACPDLLHRFSLALRRCQAEQLLRRLNAAMGEVTA